MRYLELQPPPPLGEPIECFWALEGDDLAGQPERVLPDGTVELVVNYARPFEQERGGRWVRQPRVFVVGPMSRALRLRASPGARVLGIRLRAAGAASLLRIPLRELTDQVVPLGDLTGPAFEGVLLGDGWTDPTGLAARAAKACASRLCPRDCDAGLLAAAAVERVFARRGAVRVRELAAELGVGERRLQRAFDVAVGLTPKRLARVVRLQAVLRSFASPPLSLAGVAADCGYADQAHLTHEFGELVGISPAAFLAERHELSDLFEAEERLERLLEVR